jgi:hypothetical protein
MTRLFGLVLAGLLIVLTASTTVGAFVGDAFTIVPYQPAYTPGTFVNASVTLVITPAGTATFPSGYTLTLATGLSDAIWDVRVMVDGTQAAVIPKAGDRVFVNGYLLSYPDSRDVAVAVQVRGAVPAMAGNGSFIVIDAYELDNGGYEVPGSHEVYAREVAVQPATTPATQPTYTNPTPVQTPQPTKAGLTWALLGSTLIVPLVYRWRSSGLERL